MIDLSLEILLAGDMSHLRGPACSDSSDNAVESSIRGVVDNPATLLVLVDLFHSSVELCPFVEAVPVPELTDLFDNLVLFGIATVEFD